MYSLFFHFHVLIIYGPQTLLKGLNAAPIGGCTFDVSTLVTDPSTTIASARLVELVGVGAYLGALHLITDPHILTDAGTIATIESRHQSILNLLNGATTIPQAFDMPLGPNEVLAIAGPLIKGCDLGITGTLSQHFIFSSRRSPPVPCDQLISHSLSPTSVPLLRAHN
jgi:hypothetical protein